MTDYGGRYKLQELIAGHRVEWRTFSSDDSEYHAVNAAKNLSQFKHRQFRVYDSQDDRVVWPEERT